METSAGCGTSLGLVWRFLTDSARQMLPAEEVTVEGRRFSLLRQLGEGGFSFVHLAREIPDARGEDFALKRVLLHEAEHARAVEREMATMRLFDHPNILPLLLGDVEPLPPGASPGTTRRANLVFPVYPEGTLLDRALDRPIAEALTPVQLLSVTRQICLALRCMHEHPDGPVAHRDLKPGNVLLDADPAAEGPARRAHGFRQRATRPRRRARSERRPRRARVRRRGVHRALSRPGVVGLPVTGDLERVDDNIVHLDASRSPRRAVARPLEYRGGDWGSPLAECAPLRVAGGGVEEVPAGGGSRAVFTSSGRSARTATGCVQLVEVRSRRCAKRRGGRRRGEGTAQVLVGAS